MRAMRFVVAGVLLMCAGCATTWHAGAPGDAIDVIAHRGASAYAPENTLSAFALAAEMGADWFELDCTLTADGEVIVIHDDRVDRTTNAKGAVGKMTLAELKKLDAGAWKDPRFAGERLPTLEEALQLAREKKIGVYIEIKNCQDDSLTISAILDAAGANGPGMSPNMKHRVGEMIERSKSRNVILTRKVIDLVRKYHMEKQVVLQSFSPLVCATAVIEAPKVRTEQLAAKDKKKPERWPIYLRWTDLVQPAGFNPSVNDLDQAILGRNKGAGRSVAVWTVDEEADMRRLAQWGVDAIITNKPDVCLMVLKEMGKR